MFSHLPTRQKAYLALITTSVIWGIAPPVIKHTLGYITTETFLFYRFLITCIVLLPILIYRLKKETISRDKLNRYLFLSFLSVPINLLLLFWGINFTTSNDSSVIGIISPILIILGGVIFLHEKITHRERIGIGVVFVGTILTIIQPIFEHNITSGGNIKGNLLVLAGTIAGAIFALIYKRKQNRDLNPLTLTAMSFFVGLITIYPLFILQFTPLIPPSPSWPGIVFIAIFSSAIAYFTSNYGLSKIEASEATLFTYLQPVIAVPLSVVFLKEPITIPFIVGSTFIIAGLFVAETKGKRTE